MRILYLYLLAAPILLAACKSGQKENKENAPVEKTVKTFHEIDLSGDFTESNCNNLLLSDIVEDVEYVQLETTDDCLIGEKSFYTLTDKDIYILNKKYTKEKLFRFDRTTGKFISTIGQIGQGPKDMLSPSAIYAENDYVYALSNVTNKVYTYHNNGEHVRTTSIDRGQGERITVIQNKYIIRHQGLDYITGENNYKDGDPNQYIAAAVYDMEGNKLFCKCDTLIDKGQLTLDWDPRRWYYNGQLNFYNEVDATVYVVNEKVITPRYKFNLGENRWIVRGKLTKEYLKYIKFHSFKETANYLYIYWNQRQKAYFARFNKETGKLDVNEQNPINGPLWHIYASGPKNDIDGCEIYFEPGDNYDAKAGNILFTITPDNIDAAREALKKAENVKFPEKRQKLLKMMDDRKEDDNPILVIYKLKK